MIDYKTFIESKHKRVHPVGFDVDVDSLNRNLWDWQSLAVKWSLKTGRSALYEDCGLGKSIQQLEWANQVHRYTDRPVLILCPLAVASQTKRESERFQIGSTVDIVENKNDITCKSQICITNYEKLHLFDCSVFGGVVLDESSILKSFTRKTKQRLIREFRNTRFKLACTATPDPNDRLELGNQAEFLGIMPSNEMIARWFINDSMKCGNYRLKAHGESDFWEWVASWAICISNPADLGEQFRDDKYTLPRLEIVEQFISTDFVPDGYLINPGTNVSATNVHVEKRASLIERCKAVAKLARSDNKQWILWCGTDYEANEILKQLGVKGDGNDSLGGVVEVRGSHSTAIKELRLTAFANGNARVIITKPEIGGFGLNWQHCDQMTWFASFSYEQFYQAIRRCLRFGQKSPVVRVHLIASENEESVVRATKQKELQHMEMKAGMALKMRDFTRKAIGFDNRKLTSCFTSQGISLPNWIQSH